MYGSFFHEPGAIITPVQVFCHLTFTSKVLGRYLHSTDEQTKAREMFNLSKVTQLIRGDLNFQKGCLAQSQDY